MGLRNPPVIGLAGHAREAPCADGFHLGPITKCNEEPGILALSI